ncbi:histidine kinase dimerization/phosphoacceptor domain -containing protein [Desulfamplus magnetovallimortis]|uniref:histidine kinase dimerization/phosphoacceptor domain -containing protein n=1 Tax=Desulfamplus magnetovallimortis TaxID=1246637 RepID=UPI0016480DAA|nr:transporter substrate-binding domain-containing protein [Desulfamplus magnetovallimortis]
MVQKYKNKISYVIDSGYQLIFYLTVFTLFFLVCNSPKGYAIELTKAERAYLKKKGTLVFMSQTHYPPFEFVGEDGDHTGMCIELIRWIATEFGFKALFTDSSFQEAQRAVLSGKADVLTSFFFSDKRDKTFDFTQTMFEVPATIFVSAQRPDIKDITDLKGKVVAMQAGDYAKEYLELNGINCNFNYTKNFAEATENVISGDADAVIGDEQIVLYHVFSNNLTQQIKKVGTPLYVGHNCMGLKEPGGALLSIMNKGIELARQKGVLSQIQHKWLGVSFSAEQTPWFFFLWPYIVAVLAAVALLTALVWFWNLNLREQVATKTAALTSSEKTLRTILDASPLGIGLSEGKIITWCNSAMYKILGFQDGELIGKSTDITYPDKNSLRESEKVVSEMVKSGSNSNLETRWIRKNGTSFDCRISFAPLQIENKLMVIAIAEDITDKKRAVQQIKSSLEEKELLLREIHHRVKNNMQVISSLLRLQSGKLKDEDAVSVFKDSQNRIQSIAIVHESLYQSETLSQINMQEYLETLSNQLCPVYINSRETINIRISAQDIVLSLDHAAPFGLIATELITNAMKYAVSDEHPLEIEIIASINKKSCIIVKICDSGPGFSHDIDLKQDHTLGIKLVKALVTDQLEGEWHLESAKGACWTIKWPVR